MKVETSPSRFVVLCEPRTGSNFLVSMLNSHPEILCHNEVFHPKDIFSGFSMEDFSLNRRNEDPLAFLQELFERSFRIDGVEAVGFKIFPTHDSRVLEHIYSSGSTYKIVLLKRRDRLSQYSSLKIARKTEVWSARSSEHLIQEKVRFSLFEYLRFASESDDFYRFAETRLREQGASFIKLFYEEIGDKENLNALLSFLGVKPHGDQLHGSTRRQNTRVVRRRFLNPTMAIFGSSLEKATRSLRRFWRRRLRGRPLPARVS